jgi:hypothetical protein
MGGARACRLGGRVLEHLRANKLSLAVAIAGGGYLIAYAFGLAFAQGDALRFQSNVVYMLPLLL